MAIALNDLNDLWYIYFIFIAKGTFKDFDAPIFKDLTSVKDLWK